MIYLGSEHFFKKISYFSKAEKNKVRNIIKKALEQKHQGLCNYTISSSVLLVRNKKSDDINQKLPDYQEKFDYAIEHNLWHIHAGFYDVAGKYPIDGYKISNKQDLVSDWMLHYQLRDDGDVYFLSASPHPMDILSIIITS